MASFDPNFGGSGGSTNSGAPAPQVPWGRVPAPSADAAIPSSPVIASGNDTAPSFAPSGSAAAFTVVHPPVLWSILALGAGVLGLTLAAVLGEIGPVAVVAWVVGGPVCFALAAGFVSVDTVRRTQVGYSRGNPGVASSLYVAAVVSGILAVLIAAVRLAFWAGRGF